MNRSPRSNVRRLALGRLISVTGGAAAYTALNFTVWERTHSPYMQALSLLLTFGVAGLVGPFTGALGDRFSRRAVMIWSEAISATFFALMVFAKDPGSRSRSHSGPRSRNCRSSPHRGPRSPT